MFKKRKEQIENSGHFGPSSKLDFVSQIECGVPNSILAQLMASLSTESYSSSPRSDSIRLHYHANSEKKLKKLKEIELQDKISNPTTCKYVRQTQKPKNRCSRRKTYLLCTKKGKRISNIKFELGLNVSSVSSRQRTSHEEIRKEVVERRASETKRERRELTIILTLNLVVHLNWLAGSSRSEQDHM